MYLTVSAGSILYGLTVHITGGPPPQYVPPRILLLVSFPLKSETFHYQGKPASLINSLGSRDSPPCSLSSAPPHVPLLVASTTLHLPLPTVYPYCITSALVYILHLSHPTSASIGIYQHHQVRLMKFKHH